MAPRRVREGRRIAEVSVCPRGRLDRSGGRRPYLSTLLLAYYDPGGRLVYAGRAGTGINTAELQRSWRRLQPLATATMTLDVPPPRGNRFGSSLVLSRIHRGTSRLSDLHFGLF